MSTGIAIVGALFAVMVAAGTMLMMWKSGGLWKGIAEARAVELQTALAKIAELMRENAELRAKPDMEMVSGLLVRHGLLLDQVEERLDRHATASAEQYTAILHDSAAQSAGILGALAALTKGIEDRDEAIVQALMLRGARDPNLRTRRSDQT